VKPADLRAAMGTRARPVALARPAPDAATGGSQWHGALLYAIGAVSLASAVLYYRQNVAHQLGGPISLEKILWLNYALVAWFVMPYFLARHPALDANLRTILASFLASMVTRGAIEIWLLYVTLGWSPAYGIAHDLFNIALIGGLRVRLACRLRGLADPFNRQVRRFSTTLQLGLVAEIVFAGLFYRMAVHQDAVYFAPPTEAFRHINLLTRGVDVAVYTDLALLLWRQRRTLFWQPDRSH
jgi:hypothetical protein